MSAIHTLLATRLENAGELMSVIKSEFAPQEAPAQDAPGDASLTVSQQKATPPQEGSLPGPPGTAEARLKKAVHTDSREDLETEIALEQSARDSDVPPLMPAGGLEASNRRKQRRKQRREKEESEEETSEHSEEKASSRLGLAPNTAKWTALVPPQDHTIATIGVHKMCGARLALQAPKEEASSSCGLAANFLNFEAAIQRAKNFQAAKNLNAALKQKLAAAKISADAGGSEGQPLLGIVHALTASARMHSLHARTDIYIYIYIHIERERVGGVRARERSTRRGCIKKNLAPRKCRADLTPSWGNAVRMARSQIFLTKGAYAASVVKKSLCNEGVPHLFACACA